MSLLTPPSTTHKDKENRVPVPGTHVIWSPHNQYHHINPIPQVPAANSASKTRPTKSILKKPSEALLPLANVFQRETTPEPPHPKFDPNYLSSPVSQIVNPSASLEDLIRAYSVLAARIRTSITLTTDADASWPIFDPLRKHKVAFEVAIVRDLARCLVDPEMMPPSSEDMEEDECVKEEPLLPSPKSSPKKKKKGTTARKAKYGRDLCTTCHSVIKLLGVVFTLPAVCRVFSIPQLRSILTQVLAIPLADDLPTPNARKTYALSIWLLQSQRLPALVLENAADRIAFALRRGIEGELGKEGKKGSASDGLKAIHDLSVYQPSIFVPKFETLLPSVFANLLAPTLSIRAQACHALGGLARGLATLPVSSLHTRISAATASHLTTISSPAKKSPSKTPLDPSPLVRTLRTTLSATEVQHVSQGPVWGLSVLASLLVLVNSGVYVNKKARGAFIGLLRLSSQRLKKQWVRNLAWAVWRSATWAYFQPLLPGNGEEESEVDEEATASQGRVIAESRERSTVAALLEESDTSSEECLSRVAEVLKLMTSKGGVNARVAIETLERMVSFEPPETEWDWNKLLPRGLFSASPGLLTADFAYLETPVRSILAQCPGLYDVRSLAREEVLSPRSSKKWSKFGETALEVSGFEMKMRYQYVISKIVSIWDNLLQSNVAALQDNDVPDQDTSDFACAAVNILVEVLRDTTLDVSSKAGEVRFCADGPEPTCDLSNAALKLKIVRRLWATTRKVIANAQLSQAGEKLIYCLIKEEDEFTDSGDVSRTEWATFCAEVLIVCDPEDLQEFWNYDGARNSRWEWTDAIRSTVWRCFVEKWKEESECAWESVVILLAAPFTAKKTWEFGESEYELWEAFLGHGIDKALDYGLDTVAVLDHVAANIVKEHNPTSTSASRVADLLLSQLNMEDVREIPETLFEFVNDTLRSSYPPEPRNKQQALWTLRTVVRMIEKCPQEHIIHLLLLMEEGLCTWVSDEHEALDETEYVYDSVPLYEMILVGIRYLPLDLEQLQLLGSILESGFIGRENKPTAITDAFAEFWDATYAKVPVPEGGWPAEIQTCLGIPFEELDQLDHDDPWGKLTLSPPFRGQRVVTADGKEVLVGSPFKLQGARFRSVSPEVAERSGDSPCSVTIAQPSLPVTPTTPLTVRSRPSTPPRPQRGTSVLQPSSPYSPLSAPYPPSTPSTPKRTPFRSVGSSKPSPSKRRKLDNKENESPRPVVASVIDRIVLASPRTTKVSTPSKRDTFSDRAEEARPSKRSKVDATMLSVDGSSLYRGATSSDAEEERLVEFSLLEREQSWPSLKEPLVVDEARTSPSNSKKRKRVVLDAVEVPSVQQVYGRRRKLVDGLDTFPFAFTTPSTKQTRVQTRSTSQAAHRAPAYRERPVVSRKRKRDSDESDHPFITQLVKSDNSVTGTRPPHHSSELSSDDDPFFGQVTPYHVFSPALRRARHDDPLSSDDSNMSASPLKAVVTRRLQKSRLNARLSL
ncbi:hypothetical protein B0H10DRAFT_2214900 [Mycena sp. CBHHK59/15]|nr:hypothetical protein B0H10DRAFT_2214900 [Mycena sp. CBHHK59/15]